MKKRKGPDQKNCLTNFESLLNRMTDVNLFPRAEDSLYSHIQRLMQIATLSSHKRLTWRRQLEQALLLPRARLVAGMPLIPALVGMEFMIYDHPGYRRASWFNSMYPDPRQMRVGVFRWVSASANPFRIGSILKRLEPLCQCFKPLVLDGKPVVIGASESEPSYPQLCSIMFFLEIRAFYRRLPIFLQDMFGRPHEHLSYLERNADFLCVEYIKNIEKTVAEFRREALNPFVWSPKDYSLMSRSDPKIGDYLEVCIP